MNSNKYHIVHTESSGGWGGQEIRILNEILEFMRMGHPVTLICDHNTPIAHRAKEYNIATVELPIGKKSIKGLCALKEWFKKNNFDIINTHSSSDSWMSALGMRLARNIKPLVRTRHVSSPVSNNWSTQWLYQKASQHIVTTGEKLRETLIKDNQIKPEKITSVPTGIDCSIFIPPENKTKIRRTLNLPTDKIIIGIAATLRSWKGHKYLIDAFIEMNNSNTHLLIVGDGPQWESINQQIKIANIQERVTLCGNQKNVVPWLQSMDIFTLPSYANEGVPQGIMQAMACGLTVISTDVGSITEIIQHNHTGLIVPTKNSKMLKQAISELIDEKNNNDRIAKQGLLFAQERFKLKIMSEKMSKVFSEVISEK
jgi:glycosyltransferase involved in cell wall biosynthesis